MPLFIYYLLLILLFVFFHEERLPSTNLIDLNCEMVTSLPSHSRIHEYINDVVTYDTENDQPRDVFDMREYLFYLIMKL